MKSGVVYYWKEDDGLAYVCCGQSQDVNPKDGLKHSMGYNLSDTDKLVKHLESAFGHASFEFKLIDKAQSKTLFNT